VVGPLRFSRLPPPPGGPVPTGPLLRPPMSYYNLRQEFLSHIPKLTAAQAVARGPRPQGHTRGEGAAPTGTADPDSNNVTLMPLPFFNCI